MAAIETDDPQAAIDRIAERGEQIRRRELATAVEKLRSHGDLTPGQRAAVEELSAGIVEELLAVPTETIERAPEGDREALEVALRLFDPDDE